MDTPQMGTPLPSGPDTWTLPAWLPLPGLGVLAVNAFVIRGEQPVLVDTGLGALRADFMQALGSVLDPADLRWVWITHTDPDHVGNLVPVLEQAPRARVVTNFLGMGKLMLGGLPVDRVWLVNPGQSLDLGDRRLLALRPPVYDAPETMALMDTRSGTLCSADCFGALLEAPVTSAAEVPREALRAGMLTWAGVDAPWLSLLPDGGIDGSLEAVRALAPARVLSAHLPPAEGMTDRLTAWLAEACGADPFTGPDQAAVASAPAG
jgi:hypothetical protein